ncbi:MAG: hypothetical protein AB7O66_01495 [Limisphaerales bacterium]
MITFLRLAGLVVASIWLGGTVLFVVALDPLFGRAEVVRLLGPLYSGELGLIAIQRFQLFQVLCASVALIHTLADWLYSGRPLDRRLLALLVVLLISASLGKVWLAPKCRALNIQAHLGPNQRVLREPGTPAQRQAAHSLAVWQGLGVILNVISMAGISLYFYHASHQGNGGPRPFPRSRLRI